MNRTISRLIRLLCAPILALVLLGFSAEPVDAGGWPSARQQRHGAFHHRGDRDCRPSRSYRFHHPPRQRVYSFRFGYGSGSYGCAPRVRCAPCGHRYGCRCWVPRRYGYGCGSGYRSPLSRWRSSCAGTPLRFYRCR